MTQGKGFSLIELLVTISLFAVLTSVALPSLQALFQRNKATNSANLLLTHIQLARIRAVMDNVTVVICPTVDSISCAASTDAWSKGWLVYKDLDYQQPPHVDADDILITTHNNNGSDASLHTTLSHIRFSPSGTARNGTIVICPDGAAQHARAIIISIVGRARVSTATATGGQLTCEPA